MGCTAPARSPRVKGETGVGGQRLSPERSELQRGFACLEFQADGAFSLSLLAILKESNGKEGLEKNILKLRKDQKGWWASWGDLPGARRQAGCSVAGASGLAKKTNDGKGRQSERTNRGAACQRRSPVSVRPTCAPPPGSMAHILEGS